MFSLKTKDVPPKRIFLIAFSLFVLNGGLVALCANQISSITDAEANSVKDVSIVAPDVPQEEASGSVEEFVPQDDKPVITNYVVKKGDTLSSIASQFSISTNTILWANDLTKKSLIHEGQKLTILPVSGVVYTVGKGDTLSGIAKRFDANFDEIISFNDLEDNKTIKPGMKLVIPNAEFPLEAPIKATKIVEKKETEVKKAVSAPVEAKKETPTLVVGSVSTKIETTATDSDTGQKTIIEKEPVSKGYFSFPIPGAILTQGAHGYNGVDLGAPVGTPVLAAAGGKVIVAKGENYNGGYGHYVVIEHDNGTQTLYGHLSTVIVSEGDEVAQGDKIALSGNTGRSTGPHLHFEVRGGVNPWVGIKKGTQF